ncbi:MAG: hypothetical protein CMJ81_24665 [Planctomycetaceae bacterium]|nr:hypothetical protein [Planctomycetaceae bacterium]
MTFSFLLGQIVLTSQSEGEHCHQRDKQVCYREGHDPHSKFNKVGNKKHAVQLQMDLQIDVLRRRRNFNILQSF